MTDPDQTPPTGEEIRALVVATEKAAKASEDSREREDTARHRFRVLVVWFVLVVVGLLVTDVIAWVKLNDSLTSAATSRAQIKDCIEPTGGCYQRGQARTRQVVLQLEEGVVIANCVPLYLDVPQPQQAVKIRACVTRIDSYIARGTQ